MKKQFKYFLAILPFFIFITLFELLPIIMMAVKSFVPESGGLFGIDNYKVLLTTKYFLSSIVNSIVVSLVSSAIGIAVAFLAAMSLHSASGTVKNIFYTILNITANFAGIPLAIAFIVLLGNTGILVSIGKLYGLGFLSHYNLYGINGVALIYIYFQIPVSTLLLIPAFDGIRCEWMESALLLKASRAKFWLHVGIPVLTPSILGTFCFLFANSMSAYASVYALMGSSFSLMTTLISSMVSGEVFPKYGLGSALSVIMIVLIGAAVLLNNRLLTHGGEGKSK